MSVVKDLKTHVIKENAIAILKSIYDPELPLNIYELGLIYKIYAKTHFSTQKRIQFSN